jgi:hypothetical protein
MNDRDAIEVVRQGAVWFEPAPDGFGALMDAIDDASACGRRCGAATSAGSTMQA